MSNIPLIITGNEGIAEYIKVYLIGEKRIKEGNLDVEVISHLNEDKVEQQLKGREVYRLSKLEWAPYPKSIINVEIDLHALGKPLHQASARDIAKTHPKVTAYSVEQTNTSLQMMKLRMVKATRERLA